MSTNDTAEILEAYYDNTTGHEDTCDAITRLFNEAGKPELLKEIQDFFDFCNKVWWERMLYWLDRS